ncbi:manganese-binding transcriptional regulator MntR [Aureimonas leprariae]|uniref:Transcriptional regulator MntR n=1 Tax=Plantimonas leprariae TaxID=2615207 RepID=A0A7V7PQT5_9HYPH|nr:manganese-binding transcriptional regulator MntR [Aureimonas leprariae]KAB0680753.1 manganese-binding transcriptional regulator MntR [Aureimonas leprariae]
MTKGGDDLPCGSAAERFARVRRANQSELAEDYVEMIDDLIAERGEARAADLADRFGVSPGTVARTIQRLARDGFVESQPYRSIFLTERGKQVAEDVRARHRLVFDFLVAIGVRPEAAEIDAEGIEHHVGNETLQAFRRFLEGRSGG